MYTEDEKKPYRTIRIQKRSTVSAPADITVVNADISGFNATFEGAMKALARCTKQVRDAIQKAGIPREDLRSSQLSIEQNYREEKIGEDKHGNDKFRRVPDGFLYRQNIKFEFPNDNEKLAKSIGGILDCKIEPRIEFYFRSSDVEGMKNRALADACRNAKIEAETIVQSVGAGLGKLLSVERNVRRSYDDEDYMVCNIAAPIRASNDIIMDVDPEDASVFEDVTMVWEIED